MVLILFYLTYYALARYKCNTFNNNDHYNPNVKTYKSFIQIIRYRLLLLLLLLLLLFCCLFLHVDIWLYVPAFLDIDSVFVVNVICTLYHFHFVCKRVTFFLFMFCFLFFFFSVLFFALSFVCFQVCYMMYDVYLFGCTVFI